MFLRTLSETDIQNKPVLVRAGFDVPLLGGKIIDDFRIRAVLPTLEFLYRNRAKIIIISKLGRPRGWQKNLSLEIVAQRLAELWHRKFVVIEANTTKLPEYAVPQLFFFKHNLETDNIEPLIKSLQEKDAVVLENIRFYSGETANDLGFAKKLAKFAEIYVNEDFPNVHRSHATISAITTQLPSYAGFNLVREVDALDRILSHPKKPVVVLMGGIKLADKAPAIENLAKFADQILLGGGLANLMLKVKGYEIGVSLWEEERESLARQLLRDCGEKIKLPVDVVVSTSSTGRAELVKVDKVKPHHLILDIGPETIRLYSKFLKIAQTLVWNGPVGHFEVKQFSHGTYALARLFASRCRGAAFGVAGGGETLEAINTLGMQKFIDHISTGGGALLDFLAGKPLPGLVPLLKKQI